MDEPLTREQFLADPVQRFRDDIDPAWVAEAYLAGGRFREDITDWIANSVSKIGNLGQAAYWVGVLGGRLDGAEAARLYECVRDRSERLEFEWRAEFEAAFLSAAGSLPPRQDGWYFAEDPDAEPRPAAVRGLISE